MSVIPQIKQQCSKVKHVVNLWIMFWHHICWYDIISDTSYWPPKVYRCPSVCLSRSPRKRACFYMCHLVFNMLLGPKLTIDHWNLMCETLHTNPHTLHMPNLYKSRLPIFGLELRLVYRMQAYNSSWLVRLQTRNAPRQPSWKLKKPWNATQPCQW